MITRIFLTYLLISISIPLQPQYEIKSCTTTWYRDTPRLPDHASNLQRLDAQRRTIYQGTESCQEYGFTGKAIRRINPFIRVQSIYNRIF